MGSFSWYRRQKRAGHSVLSTPQGLIKSGAQQLLEAAERHQTQASKKGHF